MTVQEMEQVAEFQQKVAGILRQIHHRRDADSLVGKYDPLVVSDAFRQEPSPRAVALRIIRAEEFRASQRTPPRLPRGTHDS